MSKIQKVSRDVARYPKNAKASVSSAWLENKKPADDEVSADIALSPTLIMYRTMREVVNQDGDSIWVAGYRDGMDIRFRVRDMTQTPSGAVRIIASLVEQVGNYLDASLRYTFTTHHFNEMDLYIARATPNLITESSTDKSK
jgi:hypothetical protein